MHIAAQGDAPISLYFFKKKGFDLNQKDTKGSTPLHWASFRGFFIKKFGFLLDF